MARRHGAFPLDVTGEEKAVGFRRMALSIGTYIGPFPGENLEVVARRLSECDVLIKMERHSREKKLCTYYRHIRFGYLTWRERLRLLWDHMDYWTYWLELMLPKTDWQHMPRGNV